LGKFFTHRIVVHFQDSWRELIDPLASIKESFG